MTQTEKLSRAHRWRVGRLASGWDGTLMVPLDGELWQVMLTEEDFRILTVTHAQEHVAPTYMILHQLRNLFFDDAAFVVQVYSEPVDMYCQGLWEIPEPPPLSGANDETHTAEAR